MEKNSRILSIEKATGISWDEWGRFMKAIDAKTLSHHEIATKVLERLVGNVKSPAWWAQSVTVAYEQAVGRRLPGQQPDGTFQASVSKATDKDMEALMKAWVAFAARDEQVNSLIQREPRVGGTEKRLTWRTKLAEGVTINIISEPKGETASLVVQLLAIPSQDRVVSLKEEWGDIVARFLDTRNQ